LLVFFSDVHQFGRAYKRKVCGIEEEYCPLAFYVFVSYCFETSVLECLNFEFRKLRIGSIIFFVLKGLVLCFTDAKI